ncbi:MAG TPA: ABC transporter ATP-binding protein [Acidobacteriaceae bacterium]|nr:ABC transporter ATP-binding protein [Acidobacteriaceae bacterium]
MTELVVETQSLVKRYGRVAALDGLSLAVPRGAVYGFLGRNGAGKTTAIRVLAGLARPQSGAARVFGLDPFHDRLAILSRTGFVIEKMLLPSMTGDDLVRFNRSFFPAWSDALAKKYAEALEVPMNRKFRRLSHGNRTKLCLLLALAHGAELLVLDEPTAGLDPVVTDQLLRLLIDDFAASGRTLLLSSHHLSEIEKIADWVGIIHHGRLLLEAQLDDIRAHYARIRASGGDLPRTAPEIVTASDTQGVSEYVLRSGAETFAAELRRSGALVLDVSPMNLSEIFLELAGKENHDAAVEVLA